MDETYIKLNGRWIYLCRAVDRYGDTVDFPLSEHRDKSAALSFFRKAIREDNIPSKVVVDKSGSNKYALDVLNTELDQDHTVQISQNKYLNNRVEQDYRFIKKRLKPVLSFSKRTSNWSKNHLSTFENFVMLIAE